jgi:chromosome partitioning protein
VSVIGLDRETLAKDIESVKAPYDFVIIDGRAKAERFLLWLA